MFVERSATRIRLVRTLFVLLGIAPCAGLAAWAVHLHSRALRQELEGRCAAIVGLPVRIGRVEHLRPDGVRLGDVSVESPAGLILFSVSALDVETSATELRLSLGKLSCTPALARALAALAQEWLARPVRFPRDCVIDVADFGWSPHDSDPLVPTRPPPGASGQACRALRVECVAANGSRAIRLRHAAGDGTEGDEVRIVAPTASAPAGGPADAAGPMEPRLEISGGIEAPVPLAIVEAVAGLRPGHCVWGAAAAVRGSFAAVVGGVRSSGTARGAIENLDLAAAGLGMSPPMAGRGTVEVRRIEWLDGRVTECSGTMSASRGRVDQRLLDGLVSMLGCRPGPAFRSLDREELRSFDEAAAAFHMDASGVELHAVEGRSGAIANVHGLAMLEAPAGRVPLGRLAWLMAPPDAAAVPASPATAWLLQVLPLPPPGGGAGAERPENVGRSAIPQAGRPVQRTEF